MKRSAQIGIGILLVGVLTAGGLELAARMAFRIPRGMPSPLQYGARQAGDQWSSQTGPSAPGGYKKYLPGTYTTHYKNRAFSIHINRLGFRGPEISARKHPNVFRVILLGESSMFGAESPEEETIRSFLEDLLRRARGSAVEVVTAGMSGADSDSIARLFHGEILTYDPDVVILYMGYNDIDRFLYYENWLYNLGPQALRRISLFYNTLITYASLWRLRTAYQDRAGIRRFVERYRANVSGIVRTGLAHGVRPMLVTQPIYLSNLAGQSRAQVLGAIRASMDRGKALRASETFLYHHQLEVDVLHDLAARWKVPLVNSVARFEGRDTSSLFRDIVHLTPEGNRAVAADILGRIMSPLAWRGESAVPN